MSKNKSLLLFVIVLLGSGVALAANSRGIRWITTDEEDEKIDRELANRVYDEACRWVEDRFNPGGQQIQPALTIHVGSECPDGDIANACLSAASGELFIPHWDETSAGKIVHATIIVGMLQLIEQQDIRKVIKSLLVDDSRNFVNAKSARTRKTSTESLSLLDRSQRKAEK